MKVEEAKRELGFSPKKVEKSLKEIIEILGKHKLTTGELIIMMSNLAYSVGAAMDGIDSTEKPDLEFLKEKYYIHPTAGISMMLTGLTMSTWYDSYREQIISKSERGLESTEDNLKI